jgi:predicted permease
MAWLRWIDALGARIRTIVRPQRADDDLRDELAFHVAMQTRANVERGMSEGEAERRARLALGGIEQTKERSRDVRPLQWADTLLRDVRYALRSLRRAPGFTTVALLTLALGLGANTAMFTIFNGVLLRPLPYPDPDRLVRLYQADPKLGLRLNNFSRPDFEDWRDGTRSFADIAAYFRLPTILTGRGEPLQLRVAYITGTFFGVLDAPAQLGRLLGEDDHRQAGRNAVISDRLWRTHFSADSRAIGSTMELRAGTFAVVGVVPATFRFPTPDTDVWIPESVLNDQLVGPRNRNNRRYEGIARLREGVQLERAQADLNVVARRLATAYSGTNAEWSATTVVPLHTAIVGDVDRALVVILAVVGFILLIGCANLANLLLARGTARSSEMAIRRALGAGQLRIFSQLLTESLVLAFVGAAMGYALAVWGVQTVVALSADTLPRVDDVRIDGRVAGFGFLLALVTGVLFGLLPAMRAAFAEPQQNLKGVRGVVGGGQRALSALVVAEVGLAVVLVIGAVLMARSFLALRGVDPGFNPERVLMASLQMNLAGVPMPEWAGHIIRRRQEIVDRVVALPGVVSAGTIDAFPLRDNWGGASDYWRVDGSGMPDGSPLRADVRIVHPDDFRAMGIPLIRGEALPDFTPDLSTGPPLTVFGDAPLPILVSEAAARRFWPDQNPLGQQLRSALGFGLAVVSGVVGDVRQRRLTEEPVPTIYIPAMVSPGILWTLVVRTNGDPQALAGAVRDVIRSLDPNQPILAIETLNDVMSESIARDRFFTLLFLLFGGLALGLAAIGVYGVLAYSVGQRTPEIGVRMALGARTIDVLGMVVGGGMRLVVIGIALGGLSSLLLTRALGSLLFEVSTTDPLAFVTALAVLGAVALLACYLPARRATRIDPVSALRAE